MSNPVWCFLVGGAHVFPVDINRTETVGHLKDGIKAERQKELARIDADELTLYRVEIDDSHTTVQVIAQLNQITQNLNKGNVLDERWQLSEVFHGLPPGKSYYVLAYPPNGQSIYSRACRCVVARMADVGLR